MLISTAYNCDGDSFAPNACITWTSGSSFAGTGDDGSVWAATLAAANDCDTDAFGRRIETASVSFGGRTVEWTWDSGRNAYDVVTTGWSLCTTDCPPLAVEAAWISRAWSDATRPDSIDITFAGFDAGTLCCGYLNGTVTLDFESGSSGLCSDGGGDSWIYTYNETMPDNCILTVQLIFSGAGPCRWNMQLYVYKSGTPMSTIPFCVALWEIADPCSATCSEVTLTQADFNAPILDEDCCDATAATFTFTLPA